MTERRMRWIGGVTVFSFQGYVGDRCRMFPPPVARRDFPSQAQSSYSAFCPEGWPHDLNLHASAANRQLSAQRSQKPCFHAVPCGNAVNKYHKVAQVPGVVVRNAEKGLRAVKKRTVLDVLLAVPDRKCPKRQHFDSQTTPEYVRRTA